MNPLELVAKTLYSFNEHQLTFDLLDAFGKRAQVFQQYDEIAKCFFELKNFSKATCFQLVPPANVVTGVDILVVVLSPSCPLLLYPQVHKVPSVLIATV